MLILSSCAREKVYYNVNYEYDSGKHCYYIEIPEISYPNVKNRNHKLGLDDVYYVKVDQYPCTETCGTLAYNEFSIAGHNKLVIYFR